MHRLTQILIVHSQITQLLVPNLDDTSSHSGVIDRPKRPLITVEYMADANDASLAEHVQDLLFVGAIGDLSIDDARYDQVNVLAPLPIIKECL